MPPHPTWCNPTQAPRPQAREAQAAAPHHHPVEVQQTTPVLRMRFQAPGSDRIHTWSSWTSWPGMTGVVGPALEAFKPTSFFEAMGCKLLSVEAVATMEFELPDRQRHADADFRELPCSEDGCPIANNVLSFRRRQD